MTQDKVVVGVNRISTETREALRLACEFIATRTSRMPPHLRDAYSSGYVYGTLDILKRSHDSATRAQAKELLMRVNIYGASYIAKLLKSVNGEGV